MRIPRTFRVGDVVYGFRERGGFFPFIILELILDGMTGDTLYAGRYLDGKEAYPHHPIDIRSAIGGHMTKEECQLARMLML